MVIELIMIVIELRMNELTGIESTVIDLLSLCLSLPPSSCLEWCSHNTCSNLRTFSYGPVVTKQERLRH